MDCDATPAVCVGEKCNSVVATAVHRGNHATGVQRPFSPPNPAAPNPAAPNLHTPVIQLRRHCTYPCGRLQRHQAVTNGVREEGDTRCVTHTHQSNTPWQPAEKSSSQGSPLQRATLLPELLRRMRVTPSTRQVNHRRVVNNTNTNTNTHPPSGRHTPSVHNTTCRYITDQAHQPTGGETRDYVSELCSLLLPPATRTERLESRYRQATRVPTGNRAPVTALRWMLSARSRSDDPAAPAP